MTGMPASVAQRDAEAAAMVAAREAEPAVAAVAALFGGHHPLQIENRHVLYVTSLLRSEYTLAMPLGGPAAAGTDPTPGGADTANPSPP